MPERVLLLGAGGKTGESYARLLQAHGHHVLWYDKNPDQLPKNLRTELLTHVPSDALDFSALKDQFDLLTLTPGVPLAQPFIREARGAGKRVVSEIAYTAPFLTDFKMIGITGTDGKSTTTTLIAQILRALGHSALECGNFGVPLSEIILERSKFLGQILVCELSSYQLEEPGDLKLDAGIFLNLAPDHLNRYDSVEEYGLAKWNIARLLKPQAPLILSDVLLPEKTAYWKARHPLTGSANPLLVVDTESLISKNFRFDGTRLAGVDLSRSAIQGRHNYANLLFALEAVRAVIPEGELNPDKALTDLKPLSHRFEVIAQNAFPQITFINDSKATTTQATLTALKNTRPEIFIFLGGQGKGEKYDELGRSLQTLGAHACIYGECKNEMAADFRSVGFNDFTAHENLFKAFHTAKRMVIQRKLAHATLLLSPAVTSWDQFSSFEERGDFFRSLVLTVK